MKNDVGYGQHIVCMLDLLGESAKYRKLESYPWPRTKDQAKEFKNDLVEFVSTIENFKADLDKFLSSTQEPRNPPANLSASELSLFNDMGGFVVKRQRFSDGILLFSGLMGDPGNGLNSLYYQIGGIASTMLMQLTRGVALRGGMALGGGAEIDESEFFGPAIMHAHEMESKVAIYPRIAVHESMLNYLQAFDELAGRPSSDVLSAFRLEMAKLCRSLITTDFDGVKILDYAGENMQRLIFRGSSIELVQDASSFAKSAATRYQGTKNLKEKYEYLSAYLVRSLKNIS